MSSANNNQHDHDDERRGEAATTRRAVDLAFIANPNNPVDDDENDDQQEYRSIHSSMFERDDDHDDDDHDDDDDNDVDDDNDDSQPNENIDDSGNDDDNNGDDESDVFESDDEEEGDDDDDDLLELEPDQTTLLTKTVVWDSITASLGRHGHFEYVYTLHLSLSSRSTVQPHGAELDVRANVTCKPRTEQIVGEEHVDRFIFSFVPDSDPIALLQATLLNRSSQDNNNGRLAQGGLLQRSIRTLLSEQQGTINDDIALEHGDFLVRQLQDEQRQEDDDDDDHALLGYFLAIESVRVAPEHRGKDLGLFMVREVLEFLKDPPPLTLQVVLLEQQPQHQHQPQQQQQQPQQQVKWTIAALVPWPQPFLLREHSNSRHKKAATRTYNYNATRKIACHFERLGFVQAAQNCEDCHTWFVTRDMYLGQHQHSQSKSQSKSSTTTINGAQQSSFQKAATTTTRPFFYVPISRYDTALYYAMDQWNEFNRDCDQEFAQVQTELLEVEQQQKETEVHYRRMLHFCREAQFCLAAALSQQRWWVRLCRRSQQQKAESLLQKTRHAIAACQDKMEAVRDRIASTRTKLVEKKAETRRRGGQVLKRLLPWTSSEIAATTTANNAQQQQQQQQLLNETMALPKAITRLQGDDMTPLAILMELGATPNFVDWNGQNALHAAAEKLKHHIIKFLLVEAGTDASVRDYRGMTPLDLVLHKRQQLLNFCQATGRPLPTVEDSLRMFESIKVFVLHDPNNYGQPIKLIGDWLSPRMAKKLLHTAEREYLELAKNLHSLAWQTNDDDDNNNNDKTVLDLARETPYINERHGFDRGVIISPEAAHHLVNGYKLVWSAVYQVLLRDMPPTYQNIRDFISVSYFWDASWLLDLNKKDERDIRPLTANHERTLEYFLAVGGSVKHVLDDMVTITERDWKKDDNRGVVDGGIMEGSSTLSSSKIEDLPGCPLDELYDIARIKCLSADT